MIDDRLLEQAAHEARNRMLDELPEEQETYVFSDLFEEKMNRMIASRKKDRLRKKLVVISKRAAVIVCAACVGLFACVMSVEAWREKLFKMVEEKFPEYSAISYEPVDGSSSDDLPEFDLVEFRPSYIPEGYILTDQILNTHINWSNYSHPDGGHISFDQSILGTANSAINTEGSELTEFEMNGETAYKMSNGGAQFVLWNDNQYQYMIVASGISLEEAVRIAESVTVCPPGAPHPPHLETDVGSLPKDYPAETALAGGDIVIYPDKSIGNLDKLDTFLSDIARKKQTIVRVADYSGSYPITRDLYYDQLVVQVTSDYTRKDPEPENHTYGEHFERIERVEREGVVEVVVTSEDGTMQTLFSYRATA